jgi:uncharacterized protein YneF (UPF0154 family)
LLFKQREVKNNPPVTANKVNAFMIGVICITKTATNCKTLQ